MNSIVQESIKQKAKNKLKYLKDEVDFLTDRMKSQTVGDLAS